MRVISITPVDKKRSKVLIEGDLALVLYRGEIRKYHIQEDEDLSEELYTEIVDTVLTKRARERALHLLEKMDRTEQDIIRKLTDGGYPEKSIIAAVVLLKKYHYIDDESYAEKYIRTYKEKKSTRMMMAELGRKGIDRSVIKKCLEDSPIDEEAQVRRILEKKGVTGEPIDAGEYQKLAGALARKGFSFDVIDQVMPERIWRKN